MTYSSWFCCHIIKLSYLISFSTSVSSGLQCPCLSSTKACIGFQLSNDNEMLIQKVEILYTQNHLDLHHQLICGRGCLLALHLPLHYYCFDGLGFPFMCLHLLRHALYFLWMDFHPCLYIYRVSTWICLFLPTTYYVQNLKSKHDLESVIQFLQNITLVNYVWAKKKLLNSNATQ